MAVTMQQKQEWLVSKGKPKSYAYFATGPNLGPEWDWNQAVSGGYTPLQESQFLETTEIKYNEKKAASKAKKAAGDPNNPSTTTGTSCAKTAAKTVFTWVNAAKQIADDWYSKVGTKFYAAADDLEGIGSVLPSDSFIKDLNKQITLAIQEVGEDADEVIAMRQLENLMKQSNTARDSGTVLFEVIDDLADGEIDGVAAGLDWLSTNVSKWDDVQAVKKAASLFSDVWVDPEPILKKISAGNVAALQARQKAAVGRVWKQLDADGLLIDFPTLNVKQLTALEAFDEVTDRLTLYAPPSGSPSGTTLELVRQGQQEQAELMSIWTTYFDNGIVSSEDIAKWQGPLYAQARKNASEAFNAVEDVTGDAYMQFVDWWAGGFPANLKGSPLEQYAEVYGTDAVAGLLGQLEDLTKTYKAYGSNGIFPKTVADEFGNLIDGRKMGVQDAFEAALEKHKVNLPGFTPTKEEVLKSLDQGFVQSVTGAKTDDLNVAVQTKLVDSGESKTLTYFMTKQQKEDYLLLPKEVFDSTEYALTWKTKTGTYDLVGNGMDVPKQKYAIKNGAVPKPKPTSTPDAGGINPVTGDAVQDATKGAAKVFDLNENQTLEILEQYKNAVPPAGKAPHYYDGQPATPKQAVQLKSLIGLADDDTLAAAKAAKIIDALDADVLTKGQASELIDFMKYGGQATVDDFKAAAVYKPMPKTAVESITDMADSVTKKLDVDADDVSLLTSAQKTEQGPVASAAKDQATSAAPPNWDAPHTFTYQGDARGAGGWHRKWWYKDENGDTWLLKNADPIYRAEAEHAAHEITYRVGLDVSESRVMYQAESGVRNKGFMQKVFPDMVDDLEGMSVNTADDIARTLTAEQLGQLQDYQVVDWMMGNMDTHSGNFIVLSDGRLVAIDKGQAFKYFGREQLSRTSSQAGNTGHNTYNEMWRAYVDGKVDIDLNRVDAMLTKVEQMSDDELRRIIAPYAKGRFPRSSMDNFTDIQTEEDFIQAVIDRKNGIRKDFESFYGKLAEERGESWVPAWQTDEIIETVKKGPFEVLTPIDDTLVGQINQTGALGRSIYVSGTDVERGQILFDVAEDASGGKVLRVNLKLRESADRRLMDLARDEGLNTHHAAAVAYKPTPSLPPRAQAAQTWAESVTGGAKTVNHHISQGDFTPNADRVAKARAALAEIEDTIKNTPLTKTDDVGDDLISAYAGITDTTAQARAIDEAAGDIARYEAAAYYRAPTENILKQADAGTAAVKVPKLEPFDVDASFKKNRAVIQQRVDAAKGDVPVLVDVSEPETVFRAGSLKVDAMKTSYIEKPPSATPLTAKVDGEIGYARTWTQVDGVTEDGWQMGYRPVNVLDSDPYHKGWMELKVGIGDELEAADIQKVVDFLKYKLGVEMDLANSRDMELLYWRMHVGVMKESKEFVDQSSKFYQGVTAAERRVSELPVGHSIEDEITALKEGFREAWGDTVDKADTLPIHKRLSGRGDTVEGVEFGNGVTEAFYVYDQDFEKVFDNAVLLHGTKDVRGQGLTGNYFDGPSGEGLLPREMKQQIGANVERGYSKTEINSLGSGGSPGWFARIRGQGRVGTAETEGYIVHPRVFRELGQYNASGDRFGKMHLRKSENHLVAASYKQRAGGANEFVGRSYATFEDDIPLISVGSEQDRARIIRELKDRGLDTWDGIAVEERVFNYRQTPTIQYWKQFRRKHGIDLNEPLRKGAKKAGSFRAAVRQTLAPKKLKQRGGVLSNNLSAGRALIDGQARVVDAGTGVARWVTIPAKVHKKENAISLPASYVEQYNLKHKSLLTTKNNIGYKFRKGGSQREELGYVLDMSEYGINLGDLSTYQQRAVVEKVVRGFAHGNFDEVVADLVTTYGTV